MNLRHTSDITCDILATRQGIVVAMIALGLLPGLSDTQAIAPKGYPLGKEP
jgi:hypothetical protein